MEEQEDSKRPLFFSKTDGKNLCGIDIARQTGTQGFQLPGGKVLSHVTVETKSHSHIASEHFHRNTRFTWSTLLRTTASWVCVDLALQASAAWGLGGQVKCP